MLFNFKSQGTFFVSFDKLKVTWKPRRPSSAKACLKGGCSEGLIVH